MKFNGSHRDWLRFWDQFTIEVHRSNKSNISKFSLLLKLVEGEPREDLFGLPHLLDEYRAKRLLQDTYGKDIWIHKALIKDLEGIIAIHNTQKIKKLDQFVKDSHKMIKDAKNRAGANCRKIAKLN